MECRILNFSVEKQDRVSDWKHIPFWLFCPLVPICSKCIVDIFVQDSLFHWIRPMRCWMPFHDGMLSVPYSFTFFRKWWLCYCTYSEIRSDGISLVASLNKQITYPRSNLIQFPSPFSWCQCLHSYTASFQWWNSERQSEIKYSLMYSNHHGLLTIRNFQWTPTWASAQSWLSSEMTWAYMA